MSANTSSRDEYGFIRPEDFDYETHEEFMSSYLRVLVRRGQKWEKLLKKGYAHLGTGGRTKRFIRKGVPAKHRPGVWMEVSGANKMRREQPNLYQEMLAMESQNKVGESPLGL